jgi:hypothetical protein
MLCGQANAPMIQHVPGRSTLPPIRRGSQLDLHNLGRDPRMLCFSAMSV